MSRKVTVVKCPDPKLATLNKIIVSGHQKEFNEARLLSITKRNGSTSLHGVISSPSVAPDHIGLTGADRTWLEIPLDEKVTVSAVNPARLANAMACMVTFTIEFHQKAKATKKALDTDQLGKEFIMKHPDQPVQLGQKMVLTVPDTPNLLLTVSSISTTDSGMEKVDENAKMGLLYSNSEIRFEAAKESGVLLKGGAVGMSAGPTVINPTWNFEEMGIGGLNEEFSAIFRRAFASRLFPSNIIADLGIKHAKGVLLYGPPGTGKTLMARQIAKMLNTRKPKIVQGPEILNKMVGESEANVRALFAEAEAEERQAGPNSGLHIIIMDELDAICKQRGSTNSGTGVHDTVVNQLLSKIDGVEQLNNILIIGMTNRKDMIDDALLRPGRLEIHMEISLPNEEGRVEILNIHTATMKASKRLADDVNIQELAEVTKNYSGADIEGLVRAAQSYSLNSFVDHNKKVEIKPEAYKQLLVRREHFLRALENDIQPAFGADIQNLKDYILYGIFPWSPQITRLLDDGALYSAQTANSDRTALVSLLLSGSRFSGKTALAVRIALNAGFPFTKIITPGKLVELGDLAKIRYIHKVFTDAYRSEVSCVILDDLEALFEYVPLGTRFNMSLVQVIATLIREMPPRGKRLMVIATSAQPRLLDQLGLGSQFTHTLAVPNVTTAAEVNEIVECLGEQIGGPVFGEGCRAAVQEALEDKAGTVDGIDLGVKRLINICMTARQAGSKAGDLFSELLRSGR